MFFTEEEVALDTNVLEWWRLHGPQLPYLARITHKYLTIQRTSMPSDIVFLAAGAVLTQLRSALHPENVDTLIFLKN